MKVFQNNLAFPSQISKVQMFKQISKVGVVSLHCTAQLSWSRLCKLYLRDCYDKLPDRAPLPVRFPDHLVLHLTTSPRWWCVQFRGKVESWRSDVSDVRTYTTLRSLRRRSGCTRSTRRTGFEKSGDKSINASKQWGSEYRTCLDFKWSKCVQLWNSSSLRWLILLLFYVLFVHWSITSDSDYLSPSPFNSFQALKLPLLFPGNVKKLTFYVLLSFFEVTDWVGGWTQNVSLLKD